MAVSTKSELIELLDQGYDFDYLLFYGHKVSPDGSVTEMCCSQWYPASFEIDGVAYPTAEHFMMAEKARLFEDTEMLERILTASSPKEAKALGRKVRNFDPNQWSRHRFDIVVKGNAAKFEQNAGFAEWLKATSNKILVEASPRDRIWGIGMSINNPLALNPRTWNGQNLLGFALTCVREQI